MPAVEFFSVLNNLDIKSIMSPDECVWYFINSTAKQSVYNAKELKKYFINDNKLIEITDEQLPVKGYYLTSYGFKKISENKFVGVDEVDYFFKITSTSND